MYANGQASMSAIAGMTDDYDPPAAAKAKASAAAAAGAGAAAPAAAAAAEKPISPSKTTEQPSRKRPAQQQQLRQQHKSEDDDNITPVGDLKTVLEALSHADCIEGPARKSAHVLVQQELEHRVFVTAYDLDATTTLKRAPFPAVTDPRFIQSQLLNPAAAHVIMVLYDRAFPEHKFKLVVNREDARGYGTILLRVPPEAPEPRTRMTMAEVQRMQSDHKEVRDLTDEMKRDDDLIKNALVNRLGDHREAAAMHSVSGFIKFFMRSYGMPRMEEPGPEYVATMPVAVPSSTTATTAAAAAGAGAGATERVIGGERTFVPHVLFYVDAIKPINGAPLVPWQAAPVPYAANTASRVIGCIRDHMRARMIGLYNDDNAYDLRMMGRDVELLENDGAGSDDD